MMTSILRGMVSTFQITSGNEKREELVRSQDGCWPNIAITLIGHGLPPDCSCFGGGEGTANDAKLMNSL